MIVDDIHFVGVSVTPNKTNSKLIIDPDTVLSCSIALQSFQAISGEDRQVGQLRSRVQLLQLALRHSRDRGQAAASTTGK